MEHGQWLVIVEPRMSRLAGKVAVVTGGGTGLGRSIACLYAEEGAKVVVADIREPDGEETVRLVREAGGEASFVLTDVRSAADVAGMVEYAVTRFGALHIATANAGILGRGAWKSLAEIPEDEFDEIMDVNFRGVWLTFKYAIPALRAAGGGVLTATSSLAAHRGIPNAAAYCSSKGAIVALVKALAVELAPDIRVNAVSAGGMRTEFAVHAREALGGVDPESIRPEVGRQTFGRVSDPREVAFAHLFLACDESSYVTGQTFRVDGGRSVVSV
jgi:NAD(P)-dependent dehydrogenase (short-subunit alcohol dehydrogenase family)